MRIGILGTGMVGQTIGTKLAALGHDVFLGAREAGNERAAGWAAKVGGTAGAGTFAQAAHYGDVLFNCTLGQGSIEAITMCGEHVDGKVMIDVSNPLDFSKGMPPSLFVSNTDSLGERIQRAFPKLKVVKALNTVNAGVMVDPGRLGDEPHAVFVSGNDHESKVVVTALLESLGWKQVIDLGDITTARGTEQYLALWVRLWGALGTADFNVRIVRGA